MISTRSPGMPDHPAASVDHHDVKRHIGAAQHRNPLLARPRATSSASGSEMVAPLPRPPSPCWPGRICDADSSPPPSASSRAASQSKSTWLRPEWRSMAPCAILVILPKPPATVTRGTGCSRIFQHAADEVAHVDQRLERQLIEALHRRLGGRAGRTGNMGEAGGARHIDAAVDRGDPGGAGERLDDAGGAEDRQAALDAEPRVPGLVGQRLAAGNGDLDLDIARASCALARSSTTARIICRGTGLIAGSPGFTGSLARVTVPTLARLETDAGPRAGQPDASDDHRPMRDVGIIAGILDDPGLRPVLTLPSSANGNAGVSPPGRVMVTGSGKSPVSNAVKAALTAAVAQAPVVQPRLSSCLAMVVRPMARYTRKATDRRGGRMASGPGRP